MSDTSFTRTKDASPGAASTWVLNVYGPFSRKSQPKSGSEWPLAVSVRGAQATTSTAAIPHERILFIDYKDNGKIWQFPEITLNLQSCLSKDPICPDGGIGRRAGLKIL